MTFQEAADTIRNGLLPNVTNGTIVSASNRPDRVRFEQPMRSGSPSVWTEWCPIYHEALKVTGPMKS